MKETILHGGLSKLDSTPQRKFYEVAVDSVDEDEVRILFVYFARPEFRWKKTYELDTKAIRDIRTSKVIKTNIASSDAAVFNDQIVYSNLIYLSGGKRGCLKEKLRGIENLDSKFRNKVVVGISAGANMLSKYYYSSVGDEVREGVGFVNVKLFCHYSDDQKDKFSRLEKVDSSTPVLTLSEGEYKVIQL